jgi:hypothetical protein
MLGPLEAAIFDTQHIKKQEIPVAPRAMSYVRILRDNQMTSNQLAILLSARREILKYPGKGLLL